MLLLGKVNLIGIPELVAQWGFWGPEGILVGRPAVGMEWLAERLQVSLPQGTSLGGSEFLSLSQSGASRVPIPFFLLHSPGLSCALPVGYVRTAGVTVGMRWGPPMEKQKSLVVKIVSFIWEARQIHTYL